MKKKFVTIFYPYQDFHFYKDPGQLPYWFSVLYGFESTVICYKKGDYITTKKHLNTHFFKKRRRRFNFFNDIFFLLRNSKKIDILNLFHFSLKNLIIATIYKNMNKKGFCYIRLDFSKVGFKEESPDEIAWFPKSRKLNERSKNFIKSKLVKAVDMWSLQDRESLEYYSGKYKFFKNKLTLSFNGYSPTFSRKINLKRFQEKENIILTVGRIGTTQKATDILLQAFSRIKDLRGWELHLAGTIEDDFKTYISDFFAAYPHLENRVIFHNYLEKDELYDLYNQSKIFCLPSRSEGMALVIPEAMYFKNALIMTDVGGAGFVTDSGKAGYIIERDNPAQLAESFEKLLNDPALLERMGQRAHHIAETHLRWEIIVERLYKDFLSHGLEI